VQSLELEIALKEVADKVANGFFLMQPREQLEFVLLFRGQLNFGPDNYLFLAPGFGFGRVLKNQVGKELAHADLVVLAVLLDLSLLGWSNVGIEEATARGLGLRP